MVNINKQHKCSICNKKFTTLNNLKQHKSIHTEKKLFQLEKYQENCKKNITKQSSNRYKKNYNAAELVMNLKSGENPAKLNFNKNIIDDYTLISGPTFSGAASLKVLRFHSLVERHKIRWKNDPTIADVYLDKFHGHGRVLVVNVGPNRRITLKNGFTVHSDQLINKDNIRVCQWKGKNKKYNRKGGSWINYSYRTNKIS